MATLETSVEANYDNDRGTPDRQKKRLIGAQATALPTKGVQSINQINCDDEYQPSQYN